LLHISLRKLLQRHSLSHEETSFSHFDRFVFGFNVVRSWRAGKNSVFKREDAEGEGGAYRRGRQMKYRDGSLVD
jgi:hypothetical protein